MSPTLTSIYTYPIKSCGGLSHQQADLDRFGLVGDRRWMVVDQEGVFLTQRVLPRMALIQPSFEPEYLRLNAPHMPELCVPLHHAHTSTRTVQVWNDRCEAWDEGNEVMRWLSDYLHTEVRLVRMSDRYSRPVNPRYAKQPADTTFSDGYPVLIASEASLDELNQRLIERGSEPVPMSRFRANLVITGASSFAEDQWKTVQVGTVTFDLVKPCGRCAITTVDQATGTIPDTAEPLATLNTFRKQGNKVMFAVNAIQRKPGMLAVGDTMQIID